MRRVALALASAASLSSLTGAGPASAPATHPAAADPAPASSPASAPAAVTFDPSSATLYFPAGSPYGPVVVDLRLDDPAAAVAACKKAAAGKDAAALAPDMQARGQLLCGIAELRDRHYEDAIADLDAAAPGVPLLAPYVSFWTAQAELARGDGAGALRLAAAIPTDSPLASDAAMLRIAAERQVGRDKEAIRDLLAWLAANPRSPRVPEAELLLATTYLRARRTAKKAAPLLRDLLVRFSLSPEAASALRMFRSLEHRRPAYDAAELDARAHAEFDAMQNRLSEQTFRRALRTHGLTPDLECDARYHEAQSVFKERQRARSAPLFDAAYKACEKTSDADLQMRALYQAGRGHMAEADYAGAVTRFLAAAKEHPEHSYADDALVRAAEAYDAENDAADAEATLAQVPARFPGGDMLGEAFFRLAYRHYKKKEYAAALAWLEKDLAAIPHETHYYAQGQALYWKARIYDLEGRADDARDGYERVVTAYPMSWYALLALNRLRAADPAAEQALVTRLRTPPAHATPTVGVGVGEDADADPLTFAPSPLFAKPGFRRAVELIRLGLGREALGELAALGLSPASAPASGDAAAREAWEQRLWLVTLLYDRAGDYAQSHWIPKEMLTGWSEHWPAGAGAALWRLAFPRAYASLVEPAAAQQGVPVPLEYAIMREESAFDPLCESFAHAMGLTQQIIPTARVLGKKLGIAVDRAALFDPATNVRLGVAEIADLLDRYHGDPALAVPAYNAGYGAVDRWIADHGDEPIDEWAEEIPYDETRNYEKRVNASYFAYQFLYGTGDPVPLVPLDAPAVEAKR